MTGTIVRAVARKRIHLQKVGTRHRSQAGAVFVTTDDKVVPVDALPRPAAVPAPCLICFRVADAWPTVMLEDGDPRLANLRGRSRCSDDCPAFRQLSRSVSRITLENTA